jgi:hypothetical protein
MRVILHRVEDVTELVQASDLGEELRGRARQMEREVITRSRGLAAANLSLRAANEQLQGLDCAKTSFFSNRPSSSRGRQINRDGRCARRDDAWAGPRVCFAPASAGLYRVQ